jgi:hypothetical protein
MFGVNRAPILHWHEHCLQMDWNKTPHDQGHIGDPSGASKLIYEPMTRSVQTVHLSCTDTNTVSKRTKMRFHLTHVTWVFYRVCAKRVLGLWYVQRKPCTYLASRLALSLNRLKWASTWASSPRSTIGSVRNIFWAYGTFDANRATILHWH